MKAEWINSIHNVSEKEWNQVFPDEVLKSITLFKVIEDSFINTIQHHYLRISDNENIIALIPCFEYRLELDVIASEGFQNLVNKIRKYRKHFFSTKVFVIGSYVATCEQYIGLKGTVTGKISELVSKEVTIKAKKLGCKLSMIKEVPAGELDFIKSVFPEFTFVDSLPNSYIPTAEAFRPYPKMLSTKQRQRFNKAKKDLFKNQLVFEKVHDFEQYADIACKLYLNVLNKSNTKFERLNEQFFRNVSKYYGDDTFLLLTKDKDNQIQAIELILTCKNKVIPIYIGINYSYEDVKCLYFNTIIHSIEYAQEKGKDYVVLGQNNYFPKALSGALIERCFLGFYSTDIVVSFLVKGIFKYLFPAFKNKAGVFYKHEAKDIVENFFNKRNIRILPDQRKRLSEIA